MQQLNEKEQRIIEYLTGEMTGEEKMAFESELLNNTSLQGEVNSMKTVRAHLSDWKDEEVQIPPLSSLTQKSSMRSSRPVVKIASWVKVAAAMLLLPIMAWLLDMRVTQNDNVMTLSFGPSISQNNQAIDLAENDSGKPVESLSPGNITSEILDSVSLLQSQFFKTWSKEYSTKIENILAKHESRQWTKLENIIARLENEQDKERSEIISTLMGVWESRRQEDLQNIEVAFLQIADALTKQQYETEELLTGIFYNTQAKNY